jgi:phenylalanyl-tRNA synthetase alpha chain
MSIPQNIEEKLNKELYLKENHPIGILKNKIFDFFDKLGYSAFDDLLPYVSVKENFDDLLIPKDHPSRSIKDTFYIDKNTVLRTHTTAHQAALMKENNKFIVVGDVFRNDTIDKTHYPIFHQIEGVEAFTDVPKEEAIIKLIERLSSLIEYLFPGIKYRINDDYFPFTNPSFEFEIFWNNEWLEVLGCGIIHEDIIKKYPQYSSAFAFGLGLERLAMILFDIPDIRYFWEEDERFLSQFSADKTDIKFKPYSNHPSCYKDISLWLNENSTDVSLINIIKEYGTDLLESTKEIDRYQKGDRISKTFRCTYRSLDRTLLNSEIDKIDSDIRLKLIEKLEVEIR